jgi:hypothetical protein
MNYAVWESVADFKRAFTDPGFQSHLKKYPPSMVVSPHLFPGRLPFPGYALRRLGTEDA